MTKEVAPAARQQCECTRAPNLLVGDSLVTREAGRFFSQLRPTNRAQAFPGARVKKVTEEVAKLNLHRDSTLLLTVGGNDLFLKNRRCGSSERIVGDFDRLIKTAKSKTSRLIVVGLVPRDYRSGEDYSRAIGVNRRLESLCQSYSIRFIDPWATFYGRVNLFQRDGTHFSSHGARVFARLLNNRLFKPVASRSWGPGRAEPRAPLAGPPSKGVTAKRAPPRKPPPEAPTKVATVPPPSPPPLVTDLVQSPHMEGSSLAPGGSGSPDPPSGPSKRPRSPPTGESVSPTQGPSQKRRCKRNKQTVLALYRALVRPLLEYGAQFWSPIRRIDVVRLEKVLAPATKLVPSIRHKGYQRRLADLELFTLEQRRLRGLLIETFKILRGFSGLDPASVFELSVNRTQNHGYKVVPPRFNTVLYKDFPTVRVCNLWNSLPEAVVNAPSVDAFKGRLDKILPGLAF